MEEGEPENLRSIRESMELKAVSKGYSHFNSMQANAWYSPHGKFISVFLFLDHLFFFNDIDTEANNLWAMVATAFRAGKPMILCERLEPRFVFCLEFDVRTTAENAYNTRLTGTRQLEELLIDTPGRHRLFKFICEKLLSIYPSERDIPFVLLTASGRNTAVNTKKVSLHMRFPTLVVDRTRSQAVAAHISAALSDACRRGGAANDTWISDLQRRLVEVHPENTLERVVDMSACDQARFGARMAFCDKMARPPHDEQLELRPLVPFAEYRATNLAPPSAAPQVARPEPAAGPRASAPAILARIAQVRMYEHTDSVEDLVDWMRLSSVRSNSHNKPLTDWVPPRTTTRATVGAGAVRTTGLGGSGTETNIRSRAALQQARGGSRQLHGTVSLAAARSVQSAAKGKGKGRAREPTQMKCVNFNSADNEDLPATELRDLIRGQTGEVRWQISPGAALIYDESHPGQAILTGSDSDGFDTALSVLQKLFENAALARPDPADAPEVPINLEASGSTRQENDEEEHDD